MSSKVCLPLPDGCRFYLRIRRCHTCVFSFGLVFGVQDNEALEVYTAYRRRVSRLKTTVTLYVHGRLDLTESFDPAELLTSLNADLTLGLLHEIQRTCRR